MLVIKYRFKTDLKSGQAQNIIQNDVLNGNKCNCKDNTKAAYRQ